MIVFRCPDSPNILRAYTLNSNAFTMSPPSLIFVISIIDFFFFCLQLNVDNYKNVVFPYKYCSQIDLSYSSVTRL